MIDDRLQVASIERLFVLRSSAIGYRSSTIDHRPTANRPQFIDHFPRNIGRQACANCGESIHKPIFAAPMAR
jgi:hypothetical protein